jgi:chromosome segregation ATPase
MIRRSVSGIFESSPAAGRICKSVAAGLMLLGATVQLSGCASCSSNDTDPTRVSTCQLLVGNDKLQQYLAQRRQHLEALGAQIELLDGELLSGQAELFKLRGEFDKAAVPSRELQALRQDIGAMQVELDQLETDKLRAEEAVKKLKAAVDREPARNAALDRQLQDVQRDVASMERKIEIVRGSIKRAAALRLKYS